MKVNDTNLNQAGASELGRTRQTAETAERGSGSRTNTAAGDSDRVSISEFSGRLLDMLSREDPPERLARIDALAEAVRSGKYEVDAMALGRRLIDEALVGA